ncbi:sensor domain-containing diguanylate cyclase [Thiohalomonas denitrificans]|uniref:sensor domain-containing diguanylate cyclase n=1 Tax=Thiohalomonas denitrificans TaxID=415747 RepID=UPI0026ECED5D|nr:diguanylate cyclase [Thiohalomonas denitrificans]
MNRALATVRAATGVLTSARCEADLLQGICDVTVRQSAYLFAWVAYPGEDGTVQLLQAMAYAGYEAGYLDEVCAGRGSSLRGAGPTSTAIRTGKTVIVRSTLDSESFAPWRDEAESGDYHACISLPLRWNKEIYGALVIHASRTDTFDQQEAEALGELADKLSAGIYFLRLEKNHQNAERALRKEKEAQEALSRILSLGLRPVSLIEKLDKVLDILFEVSWLRFEKGGAIFLTRGRELRLVIQRHLNPQQQRLCGSIPFGHCHCGQAAAQGAAVFRPQLGDDPPACLDGIVDHGHYCQPILSSKGVLGVLNLYVSAGHVQNDAEAAFVRAVSDTLAGIIEREYADQERQRLAAVVEASPDYVCIGDVDAAPSYFNSTARALLDRCGISNSASCSLFSGEASERIRQEGIPTALRDGIWQSEGVIRTQSRDLPVSQVILAPRDERGEPAFLATICRDISDRKEAETAAGQIAVREKQFANAVINSLPEVFFLLDFSGRLLRWNINLERELGYTSETLAQMRLTDLAAESDFEAFVETFTAARAAGVSIEVKLQTATGREIPYIINAMPIDEPEHTRAAIVGVGMDISDRKSLEAELERRACHDFLTGLFNRHRFTEHLERELDRADRYECPVTLILLDIDHFKSVNDTHGHEVGDRALKHVASCLQNAVRSADVLARWGGEEFVILTPETQLDSGRTLAEKLRAELERAPFPPVGSITASFGIAEYQPREGADALLKRGDDALYAAKHAGRNCVHSG